MLPTNYEVNEIKQLLINAMAKYLSGPISEISGLDAEQSTKVAEIIVNSYEDINAGLPSPEVMLFDVLDDDVIIKNENSEDEYVKMFISKWKEKKNAVVIQMVNCLHEKWQLFRADNLIIYNKK